MNHAQAASCRPGDDPQLGLGDRHQRSLGADDEPGHVEAAAADELVEVVSRHSALNLGIAVQYLGAVLFADRHQLSIDLALKSGAAHLLLKLSAVQSPEPGRVSVGEHHVQLSNVVDGLAPEYRVRAARVIPHGAADVAAVACAGVGREKHAVRRQMVVQLVEDDAGLSADPALFSVDLDYIVHVLGEVDDDGVAYRLTRQARAAASRQDGYAVAGGRLDDSDHVVGGLGKHHPDGLNLVDAGVGAVEHSGHLVEANLAFDPLPQILDQSLSVGFRQFC